MSVVFVCSDADMLDAFEKDMVLRDFLPKTIHKYRACVSVWFDECSGNIPFSQDLKYRDFKPYLVNLAAYCNDRELSVSTIRKYFTSVSAFFSFLVEEN